MKDIIISDTHFGIKQNSLTWLNSQLSFIYDELIPCIKHLQQTGAVRVIHCGDVFDSRSSINPYVANKVRQAFIDIADLCPVYVIAGNHDFYSPNEDDVSALDIVLNGILEVNVIKNEIAGLLDNDGEECVALMVPWYEFDKKDVLEQNIKDWQPRYMFCHTDLTRLSPEYTELLKGITVYSGHIHSPIKNGNLVTLGSTFALTFADSNSDRGFYILDEYSGKLQFVKSNNMIKFWRFRDKEIFDIDVTKLKNDYIELYINKLNLINQEYTDRISYLVSKIHNISVVPVADIVNNTEDLEFTNYNIQEICETSIPEELKDKFNEISSEKLTK